jgi:hypothetical protein
MTDKKIQWHESLENYLSALGERANSLSWCHRQAEQKYSSLKSIIEIPVICLSVINGAVSVGSSSLFGDSPYASVGVGAVSLITALLGAINSYYGYAKRQEGHRISSLHYGKLFRDIALALQLPRTERPESEELLARCKDLYDRLAEISPLIPPDVIASYKSKFYTMKDIHHPEDTNGLTAIHPYRPSVDSVRPVIASELAIELQVSDGDGAFHTNKI